LLKGNFAGKKIAPLLMINFIENAFKHGVKAGIEHAFVRISIEAQEHQLLFNIINSKPPLQASKTISDTGGIGLRNVKRRLAILYPRNHKLTINNTNNSFEVNLTLGL
jgi:two-component system LytT family sensor kinase